MGSLLVARFGTALSLSASLTASALAPAAPAEEDVECGWRITATHVLAELDGDDSARAQELREALIDVGADEPDFVPESCTDSGSGGDDAGSGSGPGSGAGSGSGSGSGNDSSSGGGSGSGEQGATAAEAFGWGEPDVVDDFESAGLEGWNLYDGPGHAGNGVRSPDAASVSDGILTINGTADGTTGGMAWGNSQQYGRWEVRMKAPQGDEAYNALALLWPTAENFPVGGEVDFAEIMDSSRQKVELFLHYGEDNSQVHGEVEVDATEWHNYAVEWTPDGITAFLDGEQWWKTTDTSILPPGPMHLCLQLDWFPDNGGGGGEGEVHYDWVKQWSVGEGEQSSTDSEGSDGSTDSDSSTSLTEEENSKGGRMAAAR